MTSATEVVACQTVRPLHYSFAYPLQILWSLADLAFKNGILLQAAQWCKWRSDRDLRRLTRKMFLALMLPLALEAGRTLPSVAGEYVRWFCFADRSFSKATLAYINAGELERATEQLQMCPPEDAATQYLSFLVAVNSGREIAGEQG